MPVSLTPCYLNVAKPAARPGWGGRLGSHSPLYNLTDGALPLCPEQFKMIDLGYTDIRAETAVYTFIKFDPVGVLGSIMVKIPVNEMGDDPHRTDAFTKSAEYARTGLTAQRGSKFFFEDRFEEAGKRV